MEIGTFVKRERKRKGLTQQELADMAGVGLNFVYQLEKNKKTVQLETTNQVLNCIGYEVGISRKFDPWGQEQAIESDSTDPESRSRVTDSEDS